MSQADIIQVDYQALEQIAARFGRAARAHEADLRRIDRAQWALMDSWQGQAATSFFWELTGDVMPSFRRLIGALDEAELVTLEIAATFRAAEEEAARLFQISGPVCYPAPGWQEWGTDYATGGSFGEDNPSVSDRLRRAAQEYFDSEIEKLRKQIEALIRVGTAINTGLDELEERYSRIARELIELGERWIIKGQGIDGLLIIKALRVGRLIPVIGDLFTIGAGLIDIHNTWHANSEEYAQYNPDRRNAAMLVDAGLAFLPAAGEILGGKLGILAGGVVGFGVGNVPGAVVLAALTEVGFGIVGDKLGEITRDWIIDSGSRDTLITLFEHDMKRKREGNPLLNGIVEAWAHTQNPVDHSPPPSFGLVS